METAYHSSCSSSAASYIDDSQSMTDQSAPQGRPSDSSYAPGHRTSTPASWYAALASEPPRAEDFIIYDNHDHTPLQDSQSLSQSSEAEAVASERLPTDEELEVAGDFLLYDADKKPHTFKSLYSGPEHQGTRQLIVFIRHFFCGGCRDYVRTMGRALPTSTATEVRETKVTLITFCSPSLLAKYPPIKDTNFQLFTDPKRNLFRALGCKRYAFGFGKNRPKYAHTSRLAIALGSLVDAGKAASIGTFSGGSMLQVGGEFLFEGGRPVWCHRMENYCDHTEMDVMKQVLRADSHGTDSDADGSDDIFTEEGSFACTTSFETSDAACDMAAMRKLIDELDKHYEVDTLGEKHAEDDDASALARPMALRRVTEEYSDDERANLRERPSCVPRHRSDDY